MAAGLEESDNDKCKQMQIVITTSEIENNEANKDVKSDDIENKNSNNEKNKTTDVASVAEEERFRVDRRKLESLLQDDNESEGRGKFFHKIEQATNTTISWPSKLKFGAKSKKDPYIKVAGLPEDRYAAKQMVLSVMDTKSTRVTLKMDVSFTDHSHIIGKKGNTIRRVMENTQCHIHFPDSNRTSYEKSNQVSIAGPPFCVESARRQIRELSPIVLKFDIPSQSTVTVPDINSPVIVSIAQTHNVTISFQQRLSYGFVGCVKGLHSDPFAVRDAVLKILEHLTGTVPVTVHVITQMDVDPKHHVFIIGRNECNIKQIAHSTGASITFPDPNDPNTRKSTVTISGSIEAAVTAKVYLLQFLPLILMFDIRDGDNEDLLDQNVLNELGINLDVQINAKAKPKQFCKSVIIKGYEKNASNFYKARLTLIGEDPTNMPYLTAPLATLVIPPPTMHLFNSMMPSHMNGLLNQSASPLSPPVQSSSPLQQGNSKPSLSPIPQQQQQRIIGSEVKMMKRLSVDGLFGNKDSQGDNTDSSGLSKDGLSSSRSAESILDALRVSKQVETNKEIESLALSGSWSRRQKTQGNSNHSNSSIDSGLSRSQDNLDNSSNLSMTANLLNKVALQRNTAFNAEDYELRKKMALSAMHSQVQYGKVRTPTDAWVGLGFSNSMPEAAIKELWQNREKRNKLNVRNNQTNMQASPTASLDSSASSNSSSTSHGMGHQSPTGKPVRPPPGLEDSHSSFDTSLLLNNNYDYKSMLSPGDSTINNPYAQIKTISELFRLLSLEQYTEAFEKEEVDLATFMSLTDEELKELGVLTFGARKKMTNAMKDIQATQIQSSNMGMTINAPTSLNTTSSFYPNRPAHGLDIAAHSLRW